MDIYLIRHPKVVLDVGICYGSSDVDLASDYPEAISSLQSKLPTADELYLISSPLRRCLTVAKALSQQPLTEAQPLRPNSIEVRDEIKELNFGDWELMAWNEIDPIALNDWTSDFVSRRCPNGESYQDLHERVGRFWDELIQRDQTKIAILSHGGVIRSLLTRVLKIPLENSFAIKVDPNSVTKIRHHQSHITVEYVNH